LYSESEYLLSPTPNIFISLPYRPAPPAAATAAVRAAAESTSIGAALVLAAGRGCLRSAQQSTKTKRNEAKQSMRECPTEENNPAGNGSGAGRGGSCTLNSASSHTGNGHCSARHLRTHQPRWHCAGHWHRCSMRDKCRQKRAIRTQSTHMHMEKQNEMGAFTWGLLFFWTGSNVTNATGFTFTHSSAWNGARGSAHANQQPGTGPQKTGRPQTAGKLRNSVFRHPPTFTQHTISHLSLQIVVGWPACDAASSFFVCSVCVWQVYRCHQLCPVPFLPSVSPCLLHR
jgi:hypothetical protein